MSLENQQLKSLRSSGAQAMCQRIKEEPRFSQYFKRGGGVDPGNYRQLSAWDLGKSWKNIINHYICKHLETNRMSTKRQHGYIIKRSSQINLIAFFDNMTKLVHQGNAVYCTDNPRVLMATRTRIFAIAKKCGCKTQCHVTASLSNDNADSPGCHCIPKMG